MIIQKVTLTNAQLREMPEKEREFFLFASHALNEITSLYKIYNWGITTTESSGATPPLNGVVNNAQAMIYARFLAGKLLEAWETIKCRRGQVRFWLFRGRRKTVLSQG